MPHPRALASAALGYVKKNPSEIVKAAVNAATLRFGIPLDALRYFAANAKPSKKAPKDVDIGSAPPALRLSATVEAMGTPLRVSADVKVDELTFSASSIRVGLRLSNVGLALLGESDAPVASLIKSGALDLSKPGNLVKFIPKRPAIIVEAEGDRIVLDLMKVKKIAENPKVKRVLSIITPIVSVKRVETDREHLYFALKATPAGLAEAVAAFRS